MKTAKYIQSVRPVNLLMGILIMVAVRFGLLRFNFPLPIWESLPFGLYMLSVITIMAWGYLINDYYDVETDKINRPGKNIFETKKHLFILWLLPLTGVSLPFVLNAFFNQPFFYPLLLNMLALGMLWIYSLWLKSSVLCGNLVISLLGSLLVFAPFLSIYEFNTVPEPVLVKLIIYAGFSFAVTFIRELIKDAEDLPGDAAAEIRTLATRFGLQTSKKLSYVVLGFTVFSLVIVGLQQLNSEQVVQGVAFLFLAVMGIFIYFKLIPAQKSESFKSVSVWIKVWMLLGIISMCI